MVRNSVHLCSLTLCQTFVEHLSQPSKHQPGSAHALHKICSEGAEGCDKQLVYIVYLKVLAFHSLLLTTDIMGSSH